jgi:hypothetical protein
LGRDLSESAAFNFELTHLELLDFAAQSCGECVDEPDVLRDFEVGELIATVRAELFFIGSGA